VNATDTRPLIIGVGDRWRGDEGVGPAVIAELRGTTEGTDLSETTGNLRRLQLLWAERPLAVIVAGMRSGAPRGRIRRVAVPMTDETGGFDEALRLLEPFGPGLVALCTRARPLASTPPRVVFVGVEIGPAYDGLGLSLLVADAVPEVVARCQAEVAAFVTI
jgi:hydrogenase maturation protease